MGTAHVGQAQWVGLQGWLHVPRQWSATMLGVGGGGWAQTGMSISHMGQGRELPVEWEWDAPARHRSQWNHGHVVGVATQASLPSEKVVNLPLGGRAQAPEVRGAQRMRVVWEGDPRGAGTRARTVRGSARSAGVCARKRAVARARVQRGGR